ncbi:MAG: NAD(+)/NADH kinase [Bacillota bacterium]
MDRIGVVLNPTKEAAVEAVKKAIAWLREHQIDYLIDYESAESVGEENCSASYQAMANQVDALVVFGGDGTLLNVARTFATAAVPILGVNLGGLGFLTDVELERLDQALAELVAGEFEIEERMMLEAEVIRDEEVVEQVIAVNEVVVTKGCFSRVIELSVHLDGEYLTTYPADGVIVSSPTGSTAYSLSAGGPIVNPQLDSLVVTPICPHTLHARSLVTTKEETVEIKVESNHDDVMLTADGQQSLNLLASDEIRVRKSQLVTKLIKLADSNFYKILQNRLQRSDL